MTKLEQTRLRYAFLALFVLTTCGCGGGGLNYHYSYPMKGGAVRSMPAPEQLR